jgi:hypothetical protein
MNLAELLNRLTAYTKAPFFSNLDLSNLQMNWRAVDEAVVWSFFLSFKLLEQNSNFPDIQLPLLSTKFCSENM